MMPLHQYVYNASQLRTFNSIYCHDVPERKKILETMATIDKMQQNIPVKTGRRKIHQRTRNGCLTCKYVAEACSR